MRLTGTLSVIAAVVVLAFSHSADSRPLRPDDMFLIRDVSEVQMSPDGKWVAYTVTISDRERDEVSSDLWMNRRSDGEAIQLTHTLYSEFSPRWSPDGSSLAFLSDRGDEDGNVQIWLLGLRGGEARQLSSSTISIIEFDWSPDGKQMVFTAEISPDTSDEETPQPIVIDRYFFKQDYSGYLGDERTHLFLLDVESGSITQLTDGDFYEQQPAWSPDGKRIIFVSKRGADFDRHENWDVYAMDARPGAEIHRVTSNPGSDGDSDYGWGSGAPAWSPDSAAIAYLHGGDLKDIWYGLIQIGIAGADGGKSELPAASLDRNSWQPRWSADGKSIYFLLEDNLSVQLARVRLRDGQVQRLTSRDTSVSEFDLGPNDVVAYIASSPTQPSEIWTLADGKPRRISAQNDAWLEEVDLLPATSFTFNSVDGLEIHGMLIQPASNAEVPRPLIMQMHGGPNMQYQYEFDFEWQLYPPAGYAVAGVNFRGSTGRGYAFQKRLFADWGHAEVPDVLAAVDYLVAQKIADPERLGIGGWSYGAMLTNYVIASTDRFKAAISGAGMSNMLGGYGVDQYVREWELELGRPWENTEAWLQRSYPFLHADRISTPTLFMSGAEDINVPLAGSEQMYQALKSLNVPTQLIIYPEQSHIFDRPSFNLDAYSRFLGWYDEYLSAAD